MSRRILSVDDFDPNDIRQEQMEFLADHIEEYLELLEEVMIIPDEIMDDHGDEIEEGIKRTKKLIKKLRKGDRSVFKDEDEWNSIL